MSLNWSFGIQHQRFKHLIMLMINELYCHCWTVSAFVETSYFPREQLKWSKFSWCDSRDFSTVKRGLRKWQLKVSRLKIAVFEDFHWGIVLWKFGQRKTKAKRLYQFLLLQEQKSKSPISPRDRALGTFNCHFWRLLVSLNIAENRIYEKSFISAVISEIGCVQPTLKETSTGHSVLFHK